MGITIPSHERTSNDPRTIVATGNNGHVHVVHIDIENGHNLFRCTHGYHFSNHGTFLLRLQYVIVLMYCRTNYFFRNYRLDSLASIDPTLSLHRSLSK